MCNFVPGECIAFGSLDVLHERLPTDLPGSVKTIPLRHRREQSTPDESVFDNYGFAHVTGVPHGLEVLAVSKLSAALGTSVRGNQAVVELNYALPTALPTFARIQDKDAALSDTALAWARAVRSRSFVPGPVPPPVAFIDSGVDPAHVGRRTLTSLDFTNGADGIATGTSNDKKGHGTRVARLLHESLPPEVPLVSAKIGDFDTDVTVLSLARTFAEVIARHAPAVVNVSLAPLDDTFICPRCAEPARTPAFHSTILKRVFGLAKRTFVVMAAGNDGQECNQQHSDEFVGNLVFAVAVGSELTRTRYSAAPTGPNAEQLTAYAFGGDDVGHETGTGVFVDDRKLVGTSFAAPFVSANVYSAAARLLQDGVDLERARVLGHEHSLMGTGWYPDRLPRSRT